VGHPFVKATAGALRKILPQSADALRAGGPPSVTYPVTPLTRLTRVATALTEHSELFRAPAGLPPQREPRWVGRTRTGTMFPECHWFLTPMSRIAVSRLLDQFINRVRSSALRSTAFALQIGNGLHRHDVRHESRIGPPAYGRARAMENAKNAFPTSSLDGAIERAAHNGPQATFQRVVMGKR
jgi:hypothetical protein